MHFSFATALAVVFFAMPALAQNFDHCDVVLRERAFDTTSRTTTSRMAFAARDALCSRTYDSVGSAENSARDSGFNIGYEDLSIGASDAKQNSSNQWDISETNFCTASAEDFQSAFAEEYSSEVASVAVNAWQECVRSHRENALYLEHTVHAGGAYFTGTIFVSVGLENDTLYRDVTRIAALGPGSEALSCNIAGRVVPVNTDLEEPIQLTETSTAVGCEKIGDNVADVHVSFQTSRGALGGVHLPSAQTVEDREWDRLRDQLNGMRAELSAADSELATQYANLDSMISNAGWISEIRYLRGPGSPLIRAYRDERLHRMGVSARDGFCFLTGIRGQMDGAGERALLEVINGEWQLRIRGHEGGESATRVSVDCIALRN